MKDLLIACFVQARGRDTNDMFSSSDNDSVDDEIDDVEENVDRGRARESRRRERQQVRFMIPSYRFYVALIGYKL